MTSALEKAMWEGEEPGWSGRHLGAGALGEAGALANDVPGAPTAWARQPSQGRVSKPVCATGAGCFARALAPTAESGDLACEVGGGGGGRLALRPWSGHTLQLAAMLPAQLHNPCCYGQREGIVLLSFPSNDCVCAPKSSG